jgi:Kef-type K+ transport system membrane component KefB
MSPVETLALVIAGVAVAGLISARLAVAAALVELMVGVALGALTAADPKVPWLVLLATLGGVAVTFLAGTHIDAAQMARAPRPALLLGGSAFTATFVCAFGVARFGLAWSTGAALVAALVLAETSLAVTYAVLFDLGLLGSSLGRLVTAAVFVTDLVAALALSAVITRPSWALLGFLVGSSLICAAMPRLLEAVERAHGDASSNPGLRVVLLALTGLILLAQWAGSVAVLPAFVLGVACARYYRDHPSVAEQLRNLTMTFLAPFFFVRAGMSVSLAAVSGGAGAVAALACAKIVPRWIAGYLIARRLVPTAPSAVACLMSTGLTFGMVIDLAAHEAGLIDTRQFSQLAAVVVVSAVAPAWAGQRLLHRRRSAGYFFLPSGRTTLSSMLTKVTTTAAPIVDQKNGPASKPMPRGSESHSTSLSIRAFTTKANRPRVRM